MLGFRIISLKTQDQKARWKARRPLVDSPFRFLSVLSYIKLVREIKTGRKKNAIYITQRKSASNLGSGYFHLFNFCRVYGVRVWSFRSLMVNERNQVEPSNYVFFELMVFKDEYLYQVISEKWICYVEVVEWFAPTTQFTSSEVRNSERTKRSKTAHRSPLSKASLWC